MSLPGVNTALPGEHEARGPYSDDDVNTHSPPSRDGCFQTALEGDLGFGV